MLTMDARARAWLAGREGACAVRARRALGLDRAGDAQQASAWAAEWASRQAGDGDFGKSALCTAGVLNLLCDLKTEGTGTTIEAACEYLIALLQAQPGYAQSSQMAYGATATPCDLGGFFGPYAARGAAEAMASGAREMNHLREFEPLLGPQSPVRGEPRHSRDRAGPSSCYAWGLVPLAYTLEALFRAGRGWDARLLKPIHTLMQAQRESGGWCRNLGGHPDCSLYVLRTLGAHPTLQQSSFSRRALAFWRSVQSGELPGSAGSWWTPAKAFPVLQALAQHRLPAAEELIRVGLEAVRPRQRRDGSFAGPHAVEKAAAVLQAQAALQAIESGPGA